MEANDYRIGIMTRQEIGLAVEWAAQEGWNPGLHDAECYFVADPQGFLIGRCGGEPISTISVVRYGSSFGFLGFYIVKPSFRGQGYGLRIWQAGMQRLEGRTVGLDGVLAQQDNYRKSGFELAYRNIRYQGTGGGEPSGDPAVAPLSEFPFEAVRAYDRAFFPVDRSHFLKAWIRQPGAHALGVRWQEKMAGYALLRPCRNGYKVGPLFADSAELAEALLVDLRSRVTSSDPVFLDVPEVNPLAVALAEKYRMQVSFETARMYRGQAPDLNLESTFGVTSFEIG